ncbi:MAG: CPBP family glutamic-type intramembrane protease [Chloroflexia bacterium]
MRCIAGAGWQALGCRTVRGRGVTTTILASVLATPVILLALLLLRRRCSLGYVIAHRPVQQPADRVARARRSDDHVQLRARAYRRSGGRARRGGTVSRAGLSLPARQDGRPGGGIDLCLRFSAAHVIPQLFPVLFVAGVALALTAEYFESIYPAMALHALHNGLAVVVLYFSLR